MSQQISIARGIIVTPSRIIREGCLTWDMDGTIVAVGDKTPKAGVTIDAEGMLVCPGFINLHVHGGLGSDTLDATPEAIATIAQHQAQQGVSAFLATTASASRANLLEVAHVIADSMQSQPQGAALLGLHLEGPYLAMSKCGAQNVNSLRDPDWEEFSELQEVSRHSIRVITLAPERDPNGTFIDRVVQNGIIVAAGHTDASYEVAQAAIEHGLSHAAHTFNAMSQFDYRHPRVLEALLDSEQVSLEIIPDCSTVPHVHPVALRLLKRMVGVKRLCAITDAVRAAGMPDGEYELAGIPILRSEGMAYLKEPWTRHGEKRLAGSVLEMNEGIRNLTKQVGFSLREALCTGTIHPARVLRIDDQKGTLDIGKDADIVLLSPDHLQVEATFVGGQLVYSRNECLSQQLEDLEARIQ